MSRLFLTLKPHFYLYLSCLLLILSCGKGQPDQDSSSESPESSDERRPFTQRSIQREGIIMSSSGRPSWKPIEQYSQNTIERKKSSSIGLLIIASKMSRCTAFLIGRDLIMTNNHCVSTQQEARGAVMYFNVRDSISSLDRPSYSCSTLVATDSFLDFSILKCEGTPGDDFGTIELGENPADDYKNFTSLYVIHQNCYNPGKSCSPTQKISEGHLLRSFTSTLNHNGDTLGGSSGAPIFSKINHRLVGIHFGASSIGTGYENTGSKIFSIVRFLKNSYPNIGINFANYSEETPPSSNTTTPTVPVPPTTGPILHPSFTRIQNNGVNFILNRAIVLPSQFQTLKFQDSIQSESQKHFYNLNLTSTEKFTFSLNLLKDSSLLPEINIISHKTQKIIATLNNDQGVNRDLTLEAGSYTLQIRGRFFSTGAFDLTLLKK